MRGRKVPPPYSLCLLFLLGALFSLVTAKTELRTIPPIVKFGILVVVVVGREGFELERRLCI
jgi:hypothetical protein